MRSARLRASFLVIAVASSPLACVEASRPAMQPAAGVVLDPALASVVFVRPATACDYGDPYVVIDERGEVLGEAAPGSVFVAQLPPGRHAFYAWSPRREITERDAPWLPGIDLVGALRAEVAAGAVYHVAVTDSAGAFDVRRTCPVIRRVELVAASPRTGADDELAEWLEEAELVAHDPGAPFDLGDHGDVREHVALGERTLAMADARAQRRMVLVPSDGVPIERAVASLGSHGARRVTVARR